MIDLVRPVLSYKYAGWKHSPYVNGFFYTLPRELQLQLNQDTLSNVVGVAHSISELYFSGMFNA